jgi:hypothetical protein
LKEEQGPREIAALHPGQDMEFFSGFFWKRKSRAFSRDTVGPLILLSRQWGTMLKMLYCAPILALLIYYISSVILIVTFIQQLATLQLCQCDLLGIMS